MTSTSPPPGVMLPPVADMRRRDDAAAAVPRGLLAARRDGGDGTWKAWVGVPIIQQQVAAAATTATPEARLLIFIRVILGEGSLAGADAATKGFCS